MKINKKVKKCWIEFTQYKMLHQSTFQKYLQNYKNI